MPSNTAIYKSNNGDTITVGSGGTLDAASGVVKIPRPRVLAAAGRNGAGAVTLTGAVVGDRVDVVIGAPTAGGALSAAGQAAFESVITVADQIQQSSASNLSSNTYIFVLRPAA